MRENPERGGSEVGRPNILNKLEGRESAADVRSIGARSGASRRSMTQEAAKHVMKSSRTSAFIKPPHGQSSSFVDGTVVCEDPASKLCIDENQWNNIVQENFKKFEADKKKAKEDKLNKAKMIQQEQLRQVEAKLLKNKEMKKKD